MQAGQATADLIVNRVAVSSFRCLSKVELRLDAGTTFLVGENNCGKSSLILAVATAIGHRRASTDDLQRLPTGALAANANIDVFISPPPGTNTFSDEMRQRLISVQREAGKEIVGIRTTLKQSGEGTLLAETRTFLQPAQAGWIEAPVPPFQPRILELFEAHIIDSSRDLVTEMGNQTSSWGRVLSDLRIPDLPDIGEEQPDPRGRQGLEKDLRDVSNRLKAASPVLQQLLTNLTQLAKAQASVGNIDLLALPIRLEEAARAIEVVFFQEGTAGLPLRFHGLGSRSLAALLVFQTMCILKVGADQGTRPHLVTLIEEPEAHLHPQAIASLLPSLEAMPGQRIIATHSTTLVGDVPPSKVRVLRRDAKGVSIASLEVQSDKKMEHFRRFFGRPLGDLFFARLVIFADGATERNALPVLVEMGLSANPSGLGLAFVDCESMGDHSRVNHILSILHSLGISWICYADNDSAGLDALNRINDPATGTPLTDSHACVVVASGKKQIETLLIEAGYQGEIAAVAASIGTTIVDDDGCLQFLARHKGWAAEQVALRAKANGKAPPVKIDNLISAIRARLGLASAIMEGSAQ